MKPSFSSITLIGLACLQVFAGSAQAQAATTTTGGAVPTNTTSAAVPTPTVPSFENTPGLKVTSLYKGMSVIQNSFLTISCKLEDRRPMGSIVISVAKMDGSGNTTIADIKGVATTDYQKLWNVTATDYAPGSYNINLVVTPNNNPTANVTASVAAPQSTTPAISPPVSGGASVYYYRANVNVVAPRSTPPSGAPSGRNMFSTAGYAAAAGIALFGSIFVL
ncbi:hypothetical protein FBU30_009254 [Linnemannia zychae]|nr:hypothetical protein FBU30_009254 [Linnemannia zychae]